MTFPSLILELVNTHETDPEIQIEWGLNGPQSIYIRDGWQKRTSPDDLIREALQETASQYPGNYRRLARLSDVHLDDLQEYTLLLQEAREERRQQHIAPVTRQTDHFNATWSNGRPLSLICHDMDWMLSAPRQAIVDELLTVCTPPEPTPAGAAEKRLARFLQERGSHD